MWKHQKMYALTDVLRVGGGQMIHKEVYPTVWLYFPHSYYGVINGLSESQEKIHLLLESLKAVHFKWDKITLEILKPFLLAAPACLLDFFPNGW